MKHSPKEHARKEDWGTGLSHTVEGFFSLLKRGMYGTFHSVSKRHLGLYVNEFTLRYNTWKLGDGQRVTETEWMVPSDGI